MSLIKLCYDSTPAKTESNFLPNTFPFGGFVRRRKAALQYIDYCLRVSFRANGRSVDSGRDKHKASSPQTVVGQKPNVTRGF